MNINLKNDDIFKYVFSYEYILRDFINSFLEYIGEKEKVYIENVIPQYYIMPEEKSIKEYYGDLVATLNNSDIVSLEMYSTRFRKRDYNKSYAYKCRLYTSQIKKENVGIGVKRY